MSGYLVWIVAGLILIVAALFEGLCAGRDPMGQLRRTRQPSWSLPIWAWALVGVAWYGICYTALVRLLFLWPVSRDSVLLLILTMLANGGVNLLQFRLRRLDLTFFYLLPYWALLGAFLVTACPLDGPVCLLFGLYAFYQLYAAAWQYQLWKLNSR